MTSPIDRLKLAEAATIAELEAVAAEAREASERRDRMIAAAVDAGISQARVGQAVGLSRSRVQQIAKHEALAAAAGDLLAEDPGQ